MSDVHWSRAAVLRLAVASLVLIGALFLFVFPTSAVLHQRGQLSAAEQRLVGAQGADGAARRSRPSASQSDDEIERLARDRFNMVRPGEQAWAVVPAPPADHDDHRRTRPRSPPSRTPACDASGPLTGPGAVERAEKAWGSRTLGAVASSADVERVTELLGRAPRAEFDVVVRVPDGDPVVIRNAPLLADGTPMPTRYWLVAPDLSRAVSRLEADGGVRAAAASVDAGGAGGGARASTPRSGSRALPAGWTGPQPFGGVGGTRIGVKCLHAHYAWFLAGGADPVGRWVDEHIDVAATRKDDDA